MLDGKKGNCYMLDGKREIVALIYHLIFLSLVLLTQLIIYPDDKVSPSKYNSKFLFLFSLLGNSFLSALVL